MRGWLSRAEREAQIASDLLERSPHLIQSWKLRQLQSNAAIKRCDLYLAGSLAKDCLAIATASGSKQCLGTTFGNLAHISVMSGDYLTARKCLEDALTQLDHTYMRIAAFSTGIELGLASGDQSLTANMVSRGESATTSTKDEQSDYHLFFELNRVRWLLECKQFEEAATRSSAALKIIEKLADSDLLDRMTLLAAEAQSFCNLDDQALQLFASVCTTHKNVSLETHAELNRVAAVLTARSNPSCARDYLYRAWRVLTTAGLIGRRVAIERTATMLGISLPPQGESPHSPLTMLRSLSSALQVGVHPRILGAELMAVLQSLGVQDAALLLSRPGTLPECVQRLSGLLSLRLTSFGRSRSTWGGTIMIGM